MDKEFKTELEKYSNKIDSILDKYIIKNKHYMLAKVIHKGENIYIMIDFSDITERGDCKGISLKGKIAFGLVCYTQIDKKDIFYPLNVEDTVSMIPILDNFIREDEKLGG